MPNASVKMANVDIFTPKTGVSNFQFREIILAFKTPKCGIYVAKFGIKNSKKQKGKKVVFQMLKIGFIFMKWTPGWVYHAKN